MSEHVVARVHVTSRFYILLYDAEFFSAFSIHVVSVVLDDFRNYIYFFMMAKKKKKKTNTTI